MNYFKSETIRNEIFELYDQKLSELNISFVEQDVETSFGTTHYIEAGKKDGPIVVLIHGSNGCAPIALESYPTLGNHFRVIALDVPAQPNKTLAQRPSMKGDDYSRWVNEVLVGLNLNDVTLAGFSFGGLVILKTLAYNDERIKNAFVGSPAYIANGNPLMALFKIFIPMKKYMKSGDIRFIEKFLEVLFTAKDEFAVKFLSKVFLGFEMDFTPMPVIRKEEASKIKKPISIFAAGNDLLFPGDKIINKAKKMIPGTVYTHLFEDGKHVQNASQNRIIEEQIIASTLK